jgi:spermidine/putrescine transport system permease protein
LHAVVIGHVVVSLPYAVLVILPLLQRLNVSLEEAAWDLGASPWKTFWRVTFPLLFPALLSAFLIALTLSFDEYAIASFLVGNDVTWPVFLFGQLRVPSQLPQLVAVSSVILVVSVVLVVGAEVGRRFAEKKYESGIG